MADLAALLAYGLHSGVAWLSRSLHPRTPGNNAWRPYTSAEVRQQLAATVASDDSRSQAVLAAAADVSIWMRLLSANAQREDQLGLAATRLPSALFWLRQGVSAETIGRRLSPFGEACYGNRAIDAACALIAARLNGAALPEEHWTIRFDR